jgi:hypothetical protein
VARTPKRVDEPRIGAEGGDLARAIAAALPS